MSSKIGKEPWQIPKQDFLEKYTMFIGMDVYHKTSCNRKSCAAFVATLDSQGNDLFQRVVYQESGQEIILSCNFHMGEALEAYKEKNKKYPDQIIVFRDGVGDGQVSYIRSQELQDILDTLAEKNIEKTKFAFLLINKRINHRFYKKQGDSLFNPDAGTVIADQVTNGNFEFFLTSQRVNQGTATPVYYKVLHNTTDLKEDQFWTICNDQCYTYHNWQGAVRSPGPAQYAHKLAYAHGECFKFKLHEDLENSKYQL